MRFSFRRAGSAALVFAAVLGWSAARLPVRADDGRVYTVQSADELKKRADTLLKGIIDSGAKVKYGSVAPGEKKDGVVIKDLEITSPDNKTVKIEEIVVRDFDWARPNEPLHIDLSIKKLVIPAASLEKEVTDLGLTSLTINADFDYELNSDKKSFKIEGIAIDIAELGELKLSLSLTGVALSDFKSMLGGGEKKPEGKPGEAKPSDDGAMKLLASVNIVGASLSFKDKSLVERLIKADAKKKNISEAEAKKQMLDGIAEQKKTATDEASKEVLDMAEKFVTKPGVIELAMNPSAPANAMAVFAALMASPGTVKQMLGLTLTVK